MGKHATKVRLTLGSVNYLSAKDLIKVRRLGEVCVELVLADISARAETSAQGTLATWGPY